MATRVFDGIKFCDQFLKRTSQGTFLPNLVQIGPEVREEKMFKEIVDDGNITTLKAPLEHIELRWAKMKKHFSGALVFHKHNLLKTVANDLKENGLPLKIGPKCIYRENQSVSGNPPYRLEIPMLFIMMRNNTPTLFKSYIRHCKVCTSKKNLPPFCKL